MERLSRTPSSEPNLRTQIIRRLILAALPNPDNSWQNFPEADVAEYTGLQADDPIRLEALRQKILAIRTKE